MKMCQENLDLIKMRQKCGELYVMN